jgi:hypothetical protein
MSRLKAPPVRNKRVSAKKDDELTLQEALERANDPDVAESLSLHFATLARAQREGDKLMIHEAHRAIAEAMRGMPDDGFDEPLVTALRRRDRKARRQSARPR